MRWVVCALATLLAILAAAPRAFADDFDILRGVLPIGPPTFNNWSGFYFGGQAAYSGTDADFSKATQAPIAYLLRETTLESEFSPSTWPILGSGHENQASYGGFIGYNSQWEDLILGVEANYSRMSLSMTATDSPISRQTAKDSSGNIYDVTLSGKGSISDLTFGTLRARAGWVAGNFLPYAFAGMAVGMVNSSVTATISGYENPPSSGTCSQAATPPCTLFAYTGNAGTNGQVVFGVTAGLGLDVALTSNLFLRGEYEFVEFVLPSGITVNVNSARIGAGVRF